LVQLSSEKVNFELDPFFSFESNTGSIDVQDRADQGGRKGYLERQTGQEILTIHVPLFKKLRDFNV
jgi:hypothetical protein